MTNLELLQACVRLAPDFTAGWAGERPFRVYGASCTIDGRIRELSVVESLTVDTERMVLESCLATLRKSKRSAPLVKPALRE